MNKLWFAKNNILNIFSIILMRYKSTFITFKPNFMQICRFCLEPWIEVAKSNWSNSLDRLKHLCLRSELNLCGRARMCVSRKQTVEFTTGNCFEAMKNANYVCLSTRLDDIRRCAVKQKRKRREREKNRTQNAKLLIENGKKANQTELH